MSRDPRLPLVWEDPLARGVLVVFAFCAAFFHISGVDLGFHLRTGAEVLATGSIPTTNTFSSTWPQHTWMLQQWWPGVVFYLLWTGGAEFALILFKALLVAGIFLVTYATARRQGGSHPWVCLGWVLLAILLSRSRFLIRPFLFSAFFFAVLLYGQVRWKDSRHWHLLGMPLWIAIWANTHAGVLYGWVWLGASWGGDLLQSLSQRQRPDRTSLERGLGIVLSLAVAALAVVCINPNGLKVLWVPVSMFGSDFWQRLIAEFSPATPSEFPGFWALLGVMLLFSWRRRKDLAWGNLLALWVLAWLAIRSQRSILFFSLALPPLAASWAANWKPPTSHRFQILGWGGAGVIATLVVFGLYLPDRTYRWGFGYYPRFYPHALFQFMRDHVPSQVLFHDMSLGGPVCHGLHPDFRPFIDGRLTAYPQSFWVEDYLPVMRAESGWEEILDRHAAGAVLTQLPLSGARAPLKDALLTHPDWALVAFTDSHALFLRRGTRNAETLEHFELHQVQPDWTSVGTLNSSNARAAFVETGILRQLDPQGRFVRAFEARSALLMGQYGVAAKRLESLLTEEGVSHDFWKDYLFALLRLERWEALRFAADDLLQRQIVPGYAHFILHYESVWRQDWSSAEAHLIQAVELEPENAGYRQQLEKLKGVRP